MAIRMLIGCCEARPKRVGNGTDSFQRQLRYVLMLKAAKPQEQHLHFIVLRRY